MSLQTSSQPPPPSSRPPVTGYKISINATGIMLVNYTNVTNFTIKHVGPGTYLFSVLAVNSLGEGETSNIFATGQCKLN